MWRLKACPKCRGDLFLEKDLEGAYEECIQCGYMRDVGYVHDLKSIIEAGKKPVHREREHALAGSSARKKR